MSDEFEQVIHQYSNRIRAIARRYGDENGEEDLYQEILEQLWKSFNTFKGKSALITWVYRIGFNTAMTRLRKEVSRREGLKKVEALKQTDSEIGSRCQMEIFEDFLDVLNDIDASILMMYLDGLSAKVMSDVLGMQPNAIQVRVNRMKTTFANRYVEVG